MYVQESGTKTAPTVLFLHGAGTTNWMWKGQVAAMQDYHCLVVDLPGHGKSNGNDWTTLASAADEVAEVIRTKANNGKALVVGLSLGGYTTLDLLNRHTALIERAVISGVTAAPLSLGWVMTMQTRLMSRLLKFTPVIKMQAKMLQIPPEDFEDYAAGMRSMSRQTFMRILDEITDFSAPDNLCSVTVPTLVVAGGAELKQVQDSVAIFAELMPNGQGAIVPGVHHGWNGEAPDVFNRMIRAWFTDSPLPSELVLEKKSSSLVFA